MTKVNKVKAVFSRNKILYIEFFDNFGKIKQKSTRLKDTKANRTKVQEKVVPELELRLRESVTVKLCKTFSNYADDYISLSKDLVNLKTSIYRIERMKNYFGSDLPLQSINKFDIDEFLMSLPVQRKTKKDWLTILRGMFECAFDQGALSKTTHFMSNYKLRGKNEKPNEKSILPFSIDEVHLLLKSTTDDLHNYLGIGFYTGMRPEEIIALKVSDIDYSRGLINIGRAVSKGELKVTKTSSSDRVIPLFENAIVYFEQQMKFAQKRRSIFLFTDSDGKRLNDIEDIRGKKSKNGIWYQLLKRLDLGDRKIKNTRHTFAVEAIRSGDFTQQEIASILGHANLRSLHNNYAKYLGSSHIKLDRKIDIFSEEKTDTLTDSKKIS